MGNPFSTPYIGHLEHDVVQIAGFIAIDAGHNVIGQAPVATAPGAGPYSMCKGIMKSVGFAGSVITQPYQSAGLYYFTLDEPWNCLLDWDVSLLDQGANPAPTPSVKANVRGNTTSADAGRLPGTDSTITAQTIQLRFRTTAAGGALTDIAASTGFWLRLILKRSALP